MFERLKFMTGFLGAYRRARKAGAAHETAKEAAVREMLDRHLGDADARTLGGSHVPESIAELWRDPAPAFVTDDGGWFGYDPFEITPHHIALLRAMRFSWDGAERGAPMLDPQRPYGRTDLLAQLGEAFETRDEDEIARRHVEMFFVLARALKHGVLAPGRHPLRNIGADDVREAMRGYGGDKGVTDADLGLDVDGLVTITGEHLTLLRHIEIRWPSESDCEDRLTVGEYPAAAAEPKRPYGDFTYIEVDMARILGVLPPAPEDGVFRPSEELRSHLQRLHWQMLGAMQAFVESAEIAPGVYGLDATD